MHIAPVVLAALVLPAQGLASTLDASGSCPGPVDITVAGLTPGSPSAFIFGLGPGSTVIPRGPCAGSVVDVAGARFGFQFEADGAGTASWRPTIPEEACSRMFQVLDVATCTLSNAEGLSDGLMPVASDFVGSMPTAWHDTITSPHVIAYSGSESISDGGGDMYDTGNYLRPIGDSSNLTYSAGALIESDADVDYITLELASGQVGVFTSKVPLDFLIAGNLGSDGGGRFETWTGSSGGWAATNKSVCAAGDPSVNHMVVVPDSVSVVHTPGNTSLDDDRYAGIPSDTTFFYILWAELSGRCPTPDDKQAILDALVSEI